MRAFQHSGRCASWRGPAVGPRRVQRVVAVKVVAASKMWRPALDDVDRLSRGDGAKVRGTGSRNIPHRLNADEKGTYAAAKKKGFLTVRGTGFRKERKGNPLPNIYRQWCDARCMPCVVVEQDVLGGVLDRVVIDLAPLRLLDASAAAAAAAALAAATPGVRQVGYDERSLNDVPFNTLPLLMPGTPEAAAPRWSRPGTSTGTPANVKLLVHAPAEPEEEEAEGAEAAAAEAEEAEAAEAEGEAEAGANADAGAEAGAEAEAEAAAEATTAAEAGTVAEAAAAAAVVGSRDGGSPAMHDMSSNNSSSSSSSSGSSDVDDAPLRAAAAALDAQRAAVRSLKTGPPALPNGDPLVVAAVAVLQQLKAEEERARDAWLDARAARAPPSARTASVWEAFAEDTAAPAAAGAGREGEGGEAAEEGPSPGAEAGADAGAGAGAAASHPYYVAATWQLPAEPLFYEADRATAKAFARQVAVALRALPVAAS
ncbi:hypothetical protein FOA52_000725 [Chlamydomonas sp. UWO 241]|nr:hypothetical protein FOA52_000725 [Chlamydomonas sp. UWO 241]